MKTITLSQLHNETGEWVRNAERHGELIVTERGIPIAKIVPIAKPPEENPIPYFARRKMSPEFKKLWVSGRLEGGTDVTQIISDDRD